MSAPLKEEGRAPRHRQSLPRIRKRKNMDFRPDIYAKLRGLRRIDNLGRIESDTEAIERLIASEHDRLFCAA
jgi:hypothetical protein